jgi:hypothetical protein
MLFIIAIIAILIEAYLRREAIRGHQRGHLCSSRSTRWTGAYLRREAMQRSSARPSVVIKEHQMDRRAPRRIPLIAVSGNQRQSEAVSGAYPAAFLATRLAPCATSHFAASS